MPDLEKCCFQENRLAGLEDKVARTLQMETSLREAVAQVSTRAESNYHELSNEVHMQGKAIASLIGWQDGITNDLREIKRGIGRLNLTFITIIFMLLGLLIQIRVGQ